MDNDTLRKVQLVLLEIAKEVKRVCDENGIRYYLDCGTLLGAVRHKGFIPWDDDLDIGMMREDYDRFCRIAPKCLHEDYYLQTWDNDPYYALPFAKVRKKNTVYLENKASKSAMTGFFVDIFPYDSAPISDSSKTALMNRLASIERVILMKCRYQPWNEGNSKNIKKRLGYIPYQIKAAFSKKADLIDKYMKIVDEVPENRDDIYEQYGTEKGYYLKRKFFKHGQELLFEDTYFTCPVDADGYLTAMYGDYMTPPPPSQRENRHQIEEIRF